MWISHSTSPGGRPAYHHIREPIEAHPSPVVADRQPLARTLKQLGHQKFACSTRRQRTVKVNGGPQIRTTGDPLPDPPQRPHKINNLNTKLSQVRVQAWAVGPGAGGLALPGMCRYQRG